MTPTTSMNPWNRMRSYGQSAMNRSPVFSGIQQLRQNRQNQQNAINSVNDSTQSFYAQPQPQQAPPPPPPEPSSPQQPAGPPPGPSAQTTPDSDTPPPNAAPASQPKPPVPTPTYLDSDVNNAQMMADGGIVTKPTLAKLGEKGPEAVVPLSPSANARLRPGGFLKARYQRPTGAAAPPGPMHSALPMVPNRVYR